MKDKEIQLVKKIEKNLVAVVMDLKTLLDNICKENNKVEDVLLNESLCTELIIMNNIKKAFSSCGHTSDEIKALHNKIIKNCGWELKENG